MIGDLYDAANVVVGQAAVLIAPANTVCPLITGAVLSDPFSLTPWTYVEVSASAAITAGTYDLAYDFNGTTYTAAGINWNDSAATVKIDLLAALAPLNPENDDVTVTGGPPDATTTPMFISLAEEFVGGVWTLTPHGITGGVLVLTQSIWQPVGATDQGWTWASSKNLQDITIEEQSTLVDRLVTSQQFTVTGGLSEDIGRTLALVHNMSLVHTDPTVSAPGFETLTLTDTPTQYAVAVIMANNFSFPRWLYIPAATCLDNVSTPLRRAAAKRMYSAQFTSVCQTSSIQVFNIVAPPT